MPAPVAVAVAAQQSQSQSAIQVIVQLFHALVMLKISGDKQKISLSPTPTEEDGTKKLQNTNDTVFNIATASFI